MSNIRKAACTVLAAVMLLSATLFSGCSTPEVAMTVDGQEYTTGEYLAYLYNFFNQLYYGQNLYYYEAYGQDVWKTEYPYGEEEDAEKLNLSDYIKRLAKDSIIRQKALKNKIDEYGVPERQKDLDEVSSTLSGIKADDALALGFSKANYEKMLTAVNTYEKQLFYGLYGKGGQREVSQADIEKYFNDYYLSYKIIEISLVDSSGKDLSEEETTKINERLQGYLDLYKETGDFDKVIEKYNEDEKADDDDDDDDSSSTESSTGETSAPETSSTETSSTTDTSDTSSTTDSSDSSDSSTPSDDDDEDEEEENKDPNRHDIDANLYGDEDFTNAIKTVNIDEAKIVNYKKKGTSNTAALILRLDPSKKEGVDNVLEDSREDIIYGLKYEDYNKEMEDYIATLTVEVNDTAIRMCDPKKFLG